MAKVRRHLNTGVMSAFCALLALGSMTIFSPTALAQNYPSKPVRLIIPFAPGGGTDIVGRSIAALLAERLGKQVVVENHGGAGGVLGTEMVARSQPDGHTLLLVGMAHCFSPALYRKLPYDPLKSFAPIANFANGMIGVAVNPGLPIKSVQELIALAKEKPGKLIVAAAGVGGFAHLGGVLFQMMTGIDVVTVQFKGGSAPQIDVIGGHSQVVFNGLASLLPYIQSGQLRALGVGAKKRSAMLPDVPTVSEAGVPGYEAASLFGFLAPAGTPQAIIDRLNKEILAILAPASTQKMLLSQGAEVAYMGPAVFSKYLESEMAKWGEVAKKAGIKPE